MRPTIRIPVVFVAPDVTPGSYTGALGGLPLVRDWIEKEKARVIYFLKSSMPNVDFVFYTVRNVDDAGRVLEAEKDSIGFIVFILHTWSGGATRVFLESGKPVVLIAESYGGGGEFLLEFGRAVGEGKPVVGLVVRDLASDAIARKVKLLEVIARLREMRILFVTINIEWFNKVSEALRKAFGIEAIVLDGRVFAEKYYKGVSDADAEKWARKWVSEAKAVLEDSYIDILKAAKLYIAMKKALEEYKAHSIAVDCINLFDAKVLDAWPCLGYMQLWLDCYIPVCEADPFSAIILIISWLLHRRPGFISDPVLDQQRNEVIYYHCYAPINPYGNNTRVPYTITPAHLYSKRASIYVELPVNEVVTAVQIMPDMKTIVLHKAKTLRNEYSVAACATKLVASANTDALARNWRTLWHRVVVYGDLAEDFKDLATLLGLKVIEEDK